MKPAFAASLEQCSGSSASLWADIHCYFIDASTLGCSCQMPNWRI